MVNLFHTFTLTPSYPHTPHSHTPHSTPSHSTPSHSTPSHSTQYMQFYLYLFIFFGVNILLQLFVGIVVDNFNKHKPDHSALLTVSQKRWTDLIQRLSLIRPIKKPSEPRRSKVNVTELQHGVLPSPPSYIGGCLKYLYRVFLHRWYRNFITTVIFAFSFTLVSPVSLSNL